MKKLASNEKYLNRSKYFPHSKQFLNSGTGHPLFPMGCVGVCVYNIKVHTFPRGSTAYKFSDQFLAIHHTLNHRKCITLLYSHGRICSLVLSTRTLEMVGRVELDFYGLIVPIFIENYGREGYR